jgi:hypothetical protein
MACLVVIQVLTFVNLGQRTVNIGFCSLPTQVHFTSLSSIVVEGNASREDADAPADRIVDKVNRELGAEAMRDEQSGSG